VSRFGGQVIEPAPQPQAGTQSRFGGQVIEPAPQPQAGTQSRFGGQVIEPAPQPQQTGIAAYEARHGVDPVTARKRQILEQRRLAEQEERKAAYKAQYGTSLDDDIAALKPNTDVWQEVPDLTAGQSFAAEFERNLARGLSPGLAEMIGVDEWKRRQEIARPGEGLAGKAGGLVGGMIGMADVTNVENAQMVGLGIATGGASLVAGKPVIAAVRQKAGTRVATILEHMIAGAGGNAGPGLVQAAGSIAPKRWETDPLGALAEIAAATGQEALLGSAIGTVTGTVHGQMRTRKLDLTEAELARKFPETVKTNRDLPPRAEQVEAGNTWAKQAADEAEAALVAKAADAPPMDVVDPELRRTLEEQGREAQNTPEPLKVGDTVEAYGNEATVRGFTDTGFVEIESSGVRDVVPPDQIRRPGGNQERLPSHRQPETVATPEPAAAPKPNHVNLDEHIARIEKDHPGQGEFVRSMMDREKGPFVKVEVPVERFDVKAIVDEAKGGKSGISPQKVRSYAEMTTAAPEVSAISSPSAPGKLFAADGRHRVLAAELRRQKTKQPQTVSAVVPEAWAKKQGLLPAEPAISMKPPPVVKAAKPAVPQVDPTTAAADPKLTSARAAWMDRDRKILGLDEGTPGERRSWSEALDAAKKSGVPERASGLALEVIEKPRSLNDIETAGLTVRAAEIKNRHAELLQEVAATKDPAKLSSLSAEMRILEGDFAHLSDALRKSGTEKGRALAAQKLTIDQDYSLISVTNRAKAMKEKPLTPREESFFVDMVKKLEEIDKGIRKYPAKSRERDKLEFERHRTQRRIRQRINELKRDTFWHKRGRHVVDEVVGLPRAMMASMDFSAVFRQGGFITLGHPVRASKSLVPMFKATMSERQMFRINRQIASRPNAQMYERSGLHLSDIGAELLKKEEQFRSRLADRIPGIAGSQRGFTTYLNKLRADSFDAMLETLTSRQGRAASQVELEAIANYINLATGRGKLGKFDTAGAGLADIFFAPRLVASRFEMLAGEPLYGGSMATRRMMAGEYARFLSGVGVVIALGRLAGGVFELDPRSSDFGKIVLDDTRIDILSGLGQVTRLVAREATGEKVTNSGKVVSLRGDSKFGQGDAADELFRFLRMKFSPVMGAAVDLASGKNVIGEEVTPTAVAAKAVTPLSVQDVYDSLTEHGYPRGSALALLAIFGMGIQHYSADEEPVLFKIGRTMREKVGLTLGQAGAKK
jgi:hypothetical protein